MNPGKLDRRVQLQSRVLTKDAAGGRVETWAAAGSLWAEVVTQKQAEGVTADADRNQDERTFRIRYRSGLASGTHRLVYQGRTYDILGITEEGRKSFLHLTTRAVQALSV